MECKTTQKSRPKKAQLATRWFRKVSIDTPLPEYPRPQLRRNEWFNLNGLWDYCIRSRKVKEVDDFDGKILVPYPVESVLSGVKRTLTPKQRLWYRRFFTIPEDWLGKNILLHFGAVDWETTIWIDRKLAGKHNGGYAPFTFDITDYLEPNNPNEVLIAVWDQTDKGTQNCGKQALNPFGILYTAVSGIWQTVWIEPVSNECFIKWLRIVPDIDNKTLKLKTTIWPKKADYKKYTIKITIFDDKSKICVKTVPFQEEIHLDIPDPKLWSPDFPFLYDLSIIIEKEEKIIDSVKSYFGMRKISISRDTDGIPRIQLNNKTIFQYGLLDQGYWPDGLYTAPTDNALKYDIECIKGLGFNLIRKHVKIEPARWYYHCDKLGVLVWQDIPNGGRFSYIPYILHFGYSLLTRGRKRKSERELFYKELKELINALSSFPSIVTWVPFNEGWGQFETQKVLSMIKHLDASRLINTASGWFDKKIGDIKDIHSYPDPKIPPHEAKRVLALGEFGGLGYHILGHTWTPNRAWGIRRIYWGYNKSSTRQEFFEKYAKLINNLKPLINQGLCAAVYTQTTDVEGEINGLITYDREIIKVDIDKIKALHNELYK